MTTNNLKNTETIYEIKNEMQKRLLLIQESIEEVEKLKDKWYNLYVDKRSCLDCINWDTPKGQCDKFKMVPPLNVIVNAERECKDCDYIPF
jgi:hypothetical protein